MRAADVHTTTCARGVRVRARADGPAGGRPHQLATRCLRCAVFEPPPKAPRSKSTTGTEIRAATAVAASKSPPKVIGRVVMCCDAMRRGTSRRAAMCRVAARCAAMRCAAMRCGALRCAAMRSNPHQRRHVGSRRLGPKSGPPRSSPHRTARRRRRGCPAWCTAGWWWSAPATRRAAVRCVVVRCGAMRSPRCAVMHGVALRCDMLRCEIGVARGFLFFV